MLTHFEEAVARVNLFREILVSFGKFRDISVKFRSVSESSVPRNFGKFREISDYFGKKIRIFVFRIFQILQNLR